MTMKAVLPKTESHNGRNLSSEKETVGRYSLVAYSKGKFRHAVIVKFWMGRNRNSSVVYATIWANNERHWYAGHGNASGYGYHKESAALDQAIKSAGIRLYGSPYRDRAGEKSDLKKEAHIDGCGDDACKIAIEAIARALGYRKFTII